MRRTLKLLGLLGVATAAGAAASKRLLLVPGPSAAPADAHSPATVAQEMRQALNRFEDRFSA